MATALASSVAEYTEVDAVAWLERQYEQIESGEAPRDGTAVCRHMIQEFGGDDDPSGFPDGDADAMVWSTQIQAIPLYYLPDGFWTELDQLDLPEEVEYLAVDLADCRTDDDTNGFEVDYLTDVIGQLDSVTGGKAHSLVTHLTRAKTLTRRDAWREMRTSYPGEVITAST